MRTTSGEIGEMDDGDGESRGGGRKEGDGIPLLGEKMKSKGWREMMDLGVDSGILEYGGRERPQWPSITISC